MRGVLVRMDGRTDCHRHPAWCPEAADGGRERRLIVVHGIVQGVGFRPFVSRLARHGSLAGSVRNFTGGVTIEVEGAPSDLDRFTDALCSQPPPLAVIDAVQVQSIPCRGERGFTIAPSNHGAEGPILVSPDIAICRDCAGELQTPTDRRYRHPFINCTHCGPRFTIVRGVPYDRPLTTMAPFAMCSRCAAEYSDIDDRRYHAQPVACPECGPTLELYAPAGGGVTRHGEEALRIVRELLARGCIVAVKGIGGFHLACDADDEGAVRQLRQRKHREQRPLAVMVSSLATARELAQLDEEAEALLTSPRAPIVLAPKCDGRVLASSVAPDSPDYGLLLPYTPLHMLLMADAPYRALVMTSGNLSDEPLCTENDEARRRLMGIADAFLWHDREILVGCDDSVVRAGKQGPIILRRARGYVPFPVRLRRPARAVLAVGAQIKSTFCITSGDNAFLSQHLGDLDDSRSLGFFEHSVAHFERVLQLAPSALACDLHPEYLSTRYAHDRAREAGLPLIAAQHHHAHIVSCMAENHYEGTVVGLACDGTGMGDDDTIWGCEILVCDCAGYERAGHLLEIELPGGDRAIREPWRSALAMLAACGLGGELQWLRDGPMAAVASSEWELVGAMLQRGVNCPPASSAGRLFDCVAAMLGLRLESAYEGQAAMALEAVAEETDGTYPWHIDRSGRPLVLDPTPLLAAIAADLRAGAEPSRVSGRFHTSFARALAEAAVLVAQEHRLTHVALSGGTFQNRLLLDLLCRRLRERGLTPLHHRWVPPNDGGLALGQAVIANASREW